MPKSLDSPERVSILYKCVCGGGDTFPSFFGYYIDLFRSYNLFPLNMMKVLHIVDLIGTVYFMK